MFNRIDVVTAQAKIAQNQVTIVDVRDGQSFAVDHIPEATLLTQENLSDFVANTAKNQPVLVYCYHGNSSQKAAQYLYEQGFLEVYSLDGGFAAWRSLLA